MFLDMLLVFLCLFLVVLIEFHVFLVFSSKEHASVGKCVPFHHVCVPCLSEKGLINDQ